MPKVLITFDPDNGEYFVEPYKGTEWDPEYQAVMLMRASHYQNMQRNLTRAEKDQATLAKFFIHAQTTGRQFREW